MSFAKKCVEKYDEVTTPSSYPSIIDDFGLWKIFNVIKHVIWMIFIEFIPLITNYFGFDKFFDKFLDISLLVLLATLTVGVVTFRIRFKSTLFRTLEILDGYHESEVIRVLLKIFITIIIHLGVLYGLYGVSESPNISQLDLLIVSFFISSFIASMSGITYGIIVGVPRCRKERKSHMIARENRKHYYDD